MSDQAKPEYMLQDEPMMLDIVDRLNRLPPNVLDTREAAAQITSLRETKYSLKIELAETQEAARVLAVAARRLPILTPEVQRALAVVEGGCDGGRYA